MMRSKRPWYGPFGVTTQLWINFFLMTVSNVLAVITIVTMPGLLIDFEAQCKLWDT
jgi:hypothetical protein